MSGGVARRDVRSRSGPEPRNTLISLTSSGDITQILAKCAIAGVSAVIQQSALGRIGLPLTAEASYAARCANVRADCEPRAPLSKRRRTG